MGMKNRFWVVPVFLLVLGIVGGACKKKQEQPTTPYVYVGPPAYVNVTYSYTGDCPAVLSLDGGTPVTVTATTVLGPFSQGDHSLVYQTSGICAGNSENCQFDYQHDDASNHLSPAVTVVFNYPYNLNGYDFWTKIYSGVYPERIQLGFRSGQGMKSITP
jgi:hypothetical protein